MKDKFVLLTTVSMSQNFFKGQISELNKFYDVILMSSPSEELKEIANREGVKYKGLKIKRQIAFFHDIKSLVMLMYYFLVQNIHVLHCNTPKASLLGLLAGFLTRVPHRIYYIHGLRYEGFFGFKRKLLVVMEKIACFCATEIIAVSYGIKEKAEKELTRKKVNIIHNGSANGIAIEDFINVDYNDSETLKELNISEGDFVYGFVGRIVRDKGINELVHAFTRISETEPKAKLLLVGFYEDELDPLREETKKEIKRNINIIEIGFQSDVKKYVSVMDVFVSPSYREGFGLSLLEANVMGKPVIVSRITGYSEIVRERINGFLISPKNKTELFETMLFVMNNKQILKDMKQSCKSEVSLKYNHNDVMKSAVDYYKKFLV